MSQIYLHGDCFLKEASCWIRCHFQKHNLMSAQYPLCAPRSARGPVEGRCQKDKAAETTQKSGITPQPYRFGQPPAEVPSRAFAPLPTQNKELLASAQCPRQPCSPCSCLHGVSLCGLHKGNFSPELIIVPSIPNSSLSLPCGDLA